MKKTLLLFLLASTCYGSLISGTFGWVAPSNSISFVGATLGEATSIIVPTSEVINTEPALYLGQPNDFTTLLPIGSALAIEATNTVSNVNSGFFSKSLPDYVSFTGLRFEFDLESIEWSTSAPTNLSFLGNGTLVDHLGVFTSTPAAISGSFTTTGPGAAINASFTFATLPVEVPETSTFALMGSAALILVVVRRLRN